MSAAGEAHHSQQKIKLCVQIIHDHFGVLAADVAAVLLARGRLSFPQLLKFLNAPTGSGAAVGAAAAGAGAGGGSSLPRGGPLAIAGSGAAGPGRRSGPGGARDGDTPARILPATVEHTILTLVQQNCAWHVLVSNETGAAIFGDALRKFHEKLEDIKAREGRAAAAAQRAAFQEYFEMNPDEIVPRLRFGAYVGMAHDRFGADARDIIRLILKHGKLEARDICDQLAGEDGLRRAKISRLLLLLLHRTYIRPSLTAAHISPRDKFIAYEADGKLAKRGSVFTPKELRELKEKVAIRIGDEERMEWEGGASLSTTSDGGVSKGKAAGMHASTGRLGINRTGPAASSKSSALQSSSSRSSKKRKLDATRSAASSSNGAKSEGGSGSKDEAELVKPSWDDAMDEDAMLARRGKLDVMNLTHPALAGCEVDMDIFLRVHYDRFDVHIRDDTVYQAVRAQYNTVTADVFRLFALAGEYGDAAKPGGSSGGGADAEMSSIRMSAKDERSAPISLNALSINVPEGINLSHGFHKKSFASSSGSKRKDSSSSGSGPSRAELLAEYAAVLSCSEDISSAARKRRFLAPALGGGGGGGGGASSAGVDGAGSKGKGKGKGKAKAANGDAGAGSVRSSAGKLSSAGAGGTTVSAGGTRVSNVYVVEYAEICARLKRAILKDVVADKFGAAAVRVIGVLLEKGKLEEKYISKLGLLSLSHTRHICARLFESSLLGLQEVPKSNDRQPGRTFFLWYVDLPAAYAWLLEGMYQSLARLSQRRQEEQRRERALCNKVERTDVAASMTQLLSEGEKAAWEMLQASLDRIAVAEQRLTSEAFVLANLPGE